MDPAKDVVGQLATCQDAMRIMTEGTADKWTQYITKEKQGSKGWKTGVSATNTFVEKFCVSAEGGAKMLHQITEPTPWREMRQELKPNSRN